MTLLATNGKLEEVPQQEVPEQPKPAPTYPKVVPAPTPQAVARGQEAIPAAC
jgi:hypothetical protein